MPHRFPKSRRLCSVKEIDNLLKRGKNLFAEPFRVTFVKIDGKGQDKILISVPKRNFKRAVDRNLLKRRIREAYRLNRPEETDTTHLHIMFVYTHKEILDFQHIEQQMVHILSKLH